MTLLKKYFKNVWTLEWKNEVPILKRSLIMFMLLSPFLLFVLYTIYRQCITLSRIPTRINITKQRACDHFLVYF